MTKTYGLPFDLMTLWFQAPYVIASRMSMFSGMSVGSPVAAQTEMTRMVTEKMVAATESMMAMQLALAREMMRAATATARRPDMRPVGRIVASGTRPYGKRVRANARRLSR